MITVGALAVGAALFAGSLYYVDIDMAIATGRRLGIAVPLALLASGCWHLTRTWAWSWCFPRPRTVRFSTLARIRLAAEAFSYLTISGVAGEPLKVVLLSGRVPARDATAAVALERIAYLIGTTIIIGAGSAVALASLPLSPVWLKIFRGFAIGSGTIAAALALILVRRDSYLLAAFRAADRAAGTHIASGKVGRFAGDVGRQLADLVRGNGTRLVVLTVASLVAFACMAAEAWLILRAVGVPITFTGALAMETFTRVASFATAFIPVSARSRLSLAAVTTIGATARAHRRSPGGSAGSWAGVGLARSIRAAEAGSRGCGVPSPALVLRPGPALPAVRPGRPRLAVHAHRRPAHRGARAALGVSRPLQARDRLRRLRARAETAAAGAQHLRRHRRRDNARGLAEGAVGAAGGYGRDRHRRRHGRVPRAAGGRGGAGVGVRREPSVYAHTVVVYTHSGIRPRPSGYTGCAGGPRLARVGTRQADGRQRHGRRAARINAGSGSPFRSISVGRDVSTGRGRLVRAS